MGPKEKGILYNKCDDFVKLLKTRTNFSAMAKFISKLTQTQTAVKHMYMYRQRGMGVAEVAAGNTETEQQVANNCLAESIF